MAREPVPILPASSPEWELILACARTRMDDRRRLRIRDLLDGRPLDWAFLTSLAARHRVESLVFRILDGEFADRMPAEWLARLKESCGIQARWNLHLTGRMLKLLDLFDQGGLSVIPYKGPGLASLAYGNIALRNSEDLDFVLPQRDVPKAFQLLLDAGLRSELDPSISRHARFLVRGDLGQYLFLSGPESTMVELHTERTLRYFPVPLEWTGLRTRMQTVVVGGRTFQTFSAEDLLVLLSVHGAKHFWNRLSWICDIAQLAQSPPGIDWNLSESLARRMGCRRMWLLGLSLAHGMLDAQMPEFVTRWISDEPGVALLRNKVLATPVGTDDSGFNVGERLRFRFSSHERVPDGIRQCLRVATRPTEDDWSRFVLPKWAEPLYAVMRPWRLFNKHSNDIRRKESVEAPSRVADAIHDGPRMADHS